MSDGELSLTHQYCAVSWTGREDAGSKTYPILCRFETWKRSNPVDVSALDKPTVNNERLKIYQSIHSCELTAWLTYQTVLQRDDLKSLIQYVLAYYTLQFTTTTLHVASIRLHSKLNFYQNNVKQNNLCCQYCVKLWWCMYKSVSVSPPVCLFSYISTRHVVTNSCKHWLENDIPLYQWSLPILYITHVYYV